jgi:hypothetical protein
MPPITTIAKIIAQQASSQIATGRSRWPFPVSAAVPVAAKLAVTPLSVVEAMQATAAIKAGSREGGKLRRRRACGKRP